MSLYIFGIFSEFSIKKYIAVTCNLYMETFIKFLVIIFFMLIQKKLKYL
jgi:hypothetical protein